MSISFTCEHCMRSYSVSDSLAGKKARCKGCGEEFRIPGPTPTLAPPRRSQPQPAPRQSSDLFGFDDIPAQQKTFSPVEEDVVLPRRAPASFRPSERKSRSSQSDGGEKASQFCFAGFWMYLAGFALFFSALGGYVLVNDDAGVGRKLQIIGGVIFCFLGVISMTIGQIIAIVTLIRYHEFPQVGVGGGIVWVLSFLVTPFAIYGGIKGGIEGANRGMAVQNAQAAPPGIPQMPLMPGQPAPPVQFGPPQADVRVALSSGQVSRRTTPTGIPMTGVQIRVSYSIEKGRAFAEKYVLMIKSRSSQAKLMTFNLKGSGTLSGENPTASIDDGPFEAWMELESFNGQNSRRVSDTITLNVVEPRAPQTPTNPGAQPNFGQPNNRPGMGPRFPGPMGPGQRPGRGPR